eukprot:SAG11_NODE_1357_length_5120_cov_2.888668_6_plen_271_part_00
MRRAIRRVGVQERRIGSLLGHLYGGGGGSNGCSGGGSRQYAGPDAAELHHQAVATGAAVEIATGTPRLLARIEKAVGVLTFNSPERKNALGDDFTPFLRAMIRALGDDDRVRCLLLTGAGGAFCAGGNVKAMAGGGDDVGGPQPPPAVGRTDWTGAPQPTSAVGAGDPAAGQKLKQATLTGALWCGRDDSHFSAKLVLCDCLDLQRTQPAAICAVLHRRRELPKPTVAAIPGAAAGAGMSIALACDIRLGAESAFITTGFRNVGLSGDCK